jgi:hypothetical protein
MRGQKVKKLRHKKVKDIIEIVQDEIVLRICLFTILFQGKIVKLGW